MFKKKADAVVSVCELEHPIEWSGKLRKDGNMNKFLKKRNLKSKTKKFSKNYRLNGAIYICNCKKFLKENSLFLKKKFLRTK